jgi:hypothetical protein
MSTKHHRKAATGVKMALATAAFAAGVAMPQIAAAQQVDTNTAQRIAAGYNATPVPLDIDGKDPLQVGIGSYIVNGTGVCNHCHSVDQYFATTYPQNLADQYGNPYFLPPPFGPYLGGISQGKATFIIDHSTLVAGGQDFGAVRSKNLTPGPNGNVANPTRNTPYYAAGGIDWITFWGVLHNGVDIDQLLTQCDAGSTTEPAGCTPAPTNAYELQVMPWPAVRLLTDSDLNAVWQYLGSIPCNTDLLNVNGPNGSNIANTYGNGVLINSCSPAIPASRYQYYQYVNGVVVPVPAPNRQAALTKKS